MPAVEMVVTMGTSRAANVARADAAVQRWQQWIWCVSLLFLISTLIICIQLVSLHNVDLMCLYSVFNIFLMFFHVANVLIHIDSCDKWQWCNIIAS